MAEVHSSNQVHSHWEEYWDEETGMPYYYNVETGETVWKNPTEDDTAADALQTEQEVNDNDPLHWEEIEDPDYPGKFLYHNNQSGETVNEKPDCLKNDDIVPTMKRVWFNPKGYKPSDKFPTEWRQPKKYPASKAEMLKASQMVWVSKNEF